MTAGAVFIEEDLLKCGIPLFLYKNGLSVTASPILLQRNISFILFHTF